MIEGSLWFKIIVAIIYPLSSDFSSNEKQLYPNKATACMLYTCQLRKKITYVFTGDEILIIIGTYLLPISTNSMLFQIPVLEPSLHIIQYSHCSFLWSIKQQHSRWDFQKHLTLLSSLLLKFMRVFTSIFMSENQENTNSPIDLSSRREKSRLVDFEKLFLSDFSQHVMVRHKLKQAGHLSHLFQQPLHIAFVGKF